MLEAAAHFGRHRKCFLNAHYDSRDVVYHFDTLVGLVNDFCVCVCAHIFILFFSTLFYGFSSSTLKEKKNNKNMAFKKRKEDDGSSGGGHVKKRVELHELRLLCL